MKSVKSSKRSRIFLLERKAQDNVLNTSWESTCGERAGRVQTDNNPVHLHEMAPGSRVPGPSPHGSPALAQEEGQDQQGPPCTCACFLLSVWTALPLSQATSFPYMRAVLWVRSGGCHLYSQLRELELLLPEFL